MRVIGAAESAVSRHDRMVRAEMMQAERVRSTAGVPADFWETLARQFRAPADPAADPTPDALAALIGPDLLSRYRVHDHAATDPDHP